MDETSQAPTQQPPASSKKWLWIGLGILAILIIGALFSGSVSRSVGFGAASIATGVDVDHNMDGSTTYTSENNSGTVTVGMGGSMPENWPSDAPTAYSGASIVYSGTQNPTTGQSGSAVAYTVSASVESVVEYYESRLKSEGWTIAASAEAGGARVISATKDTRVIGVYVMTDGEGTTSVTAGVQL